MRARTACAALMATLLASAAEAETETETETEAEAEADAEVIEITQRAPAEAASSVHFDAAALARRPSATPSDLLRQTPGLVVAQHAGGGKADQLFLRGFDADHGTDVAVFVDGVPVNLTSHGHGQGYADMHFVIPETVAAIDVTKGPYAARFGDFATAGAVELSTVDSLPGFRLDAGFGQQLAGPVAFAHPTMRLVALGGPRLGGGDTVLAAELGFTDGPFLEPQRFGRVAALGKWRGPAGGGTLSLATSAYAASWNQSGQIPALEVAAGRLDRFGSIDPSEGGESARGSVQVGWSRRGAGGSRLALSGFVVAYRLDLFSNFTLFARDQTHGDQIEQTDERVLAGADAAYTRVVRLFGAPAALTAGVSLRGDAVSASLWHTEARDRLPDCFAEGPNPCNDAAARIGRAGAWLELNGFVRPWLQAIAGVRGDVYLWDVSSRSPGDAGGTAAAAIASPKLSLVFRPTTRVDLFVNGGLGFHSNDARAAVAGDGQGALARAAGTEVGARVRPIERLSFAAAAWVLYLSSELVWSGDAGGTEPSDPSRRMGVDLDLSYAPRGWLLVDANLAIADSRFIPNEGNGGAVALAPRLMGGGGVTLLRGGNFVALRARGVAARPANEEETLEAQGFLVLDVVAAWQRGPWQLGLTVTNLTNTAWREAQFAEVSRVTPGGALLEDVHFTPGAPLSALLTVSRRL